MWRGAKEGEPASRCQGVYGPIGSEPDVTNAQKKGAKEVLSKSCKQAETAELATR